MRTFKLCCAAVMAAITFALSTASAADSSVVPVSLEEAKTLASTQVSYEERIQQLESRLAMIESRPMGTNRNSCPIPSRKIATNNLCNPVRYAGFELAVLKVYPGAISGSIAPLNVSGSLLPGWDFEASARFFVGCERCDGLGARLTYWQFDQSSSNAAAFNITTDLEVHALDIEATTRTEFYGSDFTFSGGIRYGYLESGINVPDLGGNILRFESEGVGPTFAARMRRHLFQSRWDMVLAGRASLLLTDASISIPGLVTVKADDSTMQVMECRIGVERTWDVTDCAQLVTQFAYEAQNWQSGAIVGLISPNYGLAGPTFRVGLNF